MRKTIQNKDSGFTIIEVLIVLAIAALILVVVLIAIPQLQRNQRNSARQNDASRVVTSVQNWSANNNGRVFPHADATALQSVVDDLGALNQYVIEPTNTDLEAEDGSGATVPSPVTDINEIRIVTGATCGDDGEVTNSGVSSRAVAVQFAAETAGGEESRCISS